MHIRCDRTRAVQRRCLIGQCACPFSLAYLSVCVCVQARDRSRAVADKFALERVLKIRDMAQVVVGILPRWFGFFSR